MIEALMYLAIGALLAGLLGIALLPSLWRRAERLSRQRLMATLPVTPDEMAAEKDQIRAAAAVDVRRLELRAEAVDGQLQKARKDIGAHVATIQQREATIAARDATIAGLQSDLAARRADIAQLEQTIASLTQERDNLATNLNTSRISNQALDLEGSALRQVAEQRQALLAAQEKQIAVLGEKAAEFQTAATNFRNDLRTKTEELRASARSLRETTARASILERKLAATETLAAEKAALIERLQAERLRLIEDAGQLQRERDGERIEREAREAEIARLGHHIADLQASAERSRLAHAETLRDLTRTIETLRHEKHQFDSEISSVRLENARLAGQISAQRVSQPRRRRTPAE